MITMDEQARLAALHADAALDALERLLVEHREVVKRRMLRRIEREGLDEYGDKTWHKPDEACWMEALDELADGVFYMVVPLARAAGDIPPRT